MKYIVPYTYISYYRCRFASLSYLVGDLVGFSYGDKIDTIGVQFVAPSFSKLISFLVFHL